MNAENELFVDFIQKFPEWSAQDVEQNTTRTLSVLWISFKCLFAVFKELGTLDLIFFSVIIYVTLTRTTKHWNVQIERHCHFRLCKPF
jgi:hypothetical protein